MADATANTTASEPGVWTHNVPNRSPTLIIVSAIFIVITTLFFAFRQGWRWAHKQRGWDDLMAAFAYAILVIQTIFGGVAAHYGFGKHIQLIRHTVPKALMYFYLYQICYKLLGGFTKLTFCFLYLRIFNQKAFRQRVAVIAAIVAVGSLVFALGTVFQCAPVRHTWDRTVPGHCMDNEIFWYTHAAFNTFFDIVVSGGVVTPVAWQIKADPVARSSSYRSRSLAACNSPAARRRA